MVVLVNAGNISIIQGPKWMSSALICVSTGGPVTSVTWKRDNIEISSETNTVLTDLVTAEYIHSLTMIEGQTGIYQCTVSNNIMSTISGRINIQG